MSTKDALTELGVKVTSTSKCLPTDEACKAKEDAAAAKAKIEADKAAAGEYKPTEFKPKVTATGLECSMDGFVKMIKEMTEVALMGITLVKETVLTAAPESLSMAIKYLWDGMTGLGNWMGYALAAGYYIGLDYNAGDAVCEAFGYGYYVIDGLHYLVDFAGKSAPADGTATDASATDASTAAVPAPIADAAKATTGTATPAKP